MANPNEFNPKPYSADAEQGGHHGPEDKIYRLTRGTPAARDAPGAGEANKLTVSLWLGRDRRVIADPLPLTAREVA